MAQPAYHHCDQINHFYRRDGNSNLLCEAGTPGCACLDMTHKSKFEPSDTNVIYKYDCPASRQCLANAPCVSLSDGQADQCVYFSSQADSPTTHDAPNGWGIQGLISSALPAQVISTLEMYDSVTNFVCWQAMEQAAAELGITEIAAELYPPFGFIAEQLLMYDLWNSGFGQLCEGADATRQSLEQKVFGESTDFQKYKDSISACENNVLMDKFEDVGFAASPRVCFPCGTVEDPIPEKILDVCNEIAGANYPRCCDPPGPPQPGPGTVCSHPEQPCSSIFGINERAKADPSVSVCTCGFPCEEKAAGNVCIRPSGPGICTQEPGVFFLQCYPLEVPLCSSLRGIVKPPGGCQDAPHYDDPAFKEHRKACAPYPDRPELWTCHMENGCPDDYPNVECYWDGKWSQTYRASEKCFDFSDAKLYNPKRMLSS